MAKVFLNDLGSLQNETSATNTINANMDRIETAMEKTLSRDGTAPNAMLSSLDMNSQRILNLPLPLDDSEPARLGDVTDLSVEGFSFGAVSTGTPAGTDYFLFGDVSDEDTNKKATINTILATADLVTGPGSATDNAVVRFDGTAGDTLQNSIVTISDTGDVVASSLALTTDLPVSEGGTGASNASGARTNLGVVIGTDVQAFDSDLSAVAGLSSTGLISRTGTGTASVRTLTAPAAGITVTNGDGVSGNPTLVLANDLAAVEGLSSTGLISRTATDTMAVRTLTAPAAGISVSNGDGVSGNPTLALANDLSALEALSSTGLAARTTTDTWAQRTITAPAAGITVSNGDGVSGNPTLVLANDLSAVEGLASNGVAVRTATDTWTVRTITGTANEITSTNGDGVSGAPTLSLPSALTFTGKTVTGGTFSGASATGVFDIQALSLSSDITPSQITSNQNDYAPTGFSTAIILRLSSDASRNITGLAGGTDGLVKSLINVGTQDIVLKNETTSTAANQFKFGADVTLAASQGALIVYDSTSSRWRCMALFTSAGGGSGTVTSVAASTGLLGGTITSSGTITTGADSRLSNLGLAVSAGAGALTIALKGADGNDPSSSNPVDIDFRNVTGTTGTPSTLSLTAATSLVISSGSTLGVSSTTAFRLWVVGFNDGGTFRLGVINCRSGTSIFPLNDHILASSTTEGGAGAADSAQVFYSGTGVSSKAYRILGFLEWDASGLTAGTWTTTNLIKVQLFGPGVSKPGTVLQRQPTFTGAVATGTTTIPNDDTIPQITEGDEYMTQAITPRSAANILEIRAQVAMSHSAGTHNCVGLFQDATANALAAIIHYAGAATNVIAIPVTWRMLSSTVSATTFRIRAGSAAGGTTTFNGSAGGRGLGGVMNSFIIVEEIVA